MQLSQSNWAFVTPNHECDSFYGIEGGKPVDWCSSIMAPDLDEFDDAMILKTFGDVPDDFISVST